MMNKMVKTSKKVMVIMAMTAKKITEKWRSIKFVQKTGDKISNGFFNVTNKEVLCST
jgi:hypothetical protein